MPALNEIYARVTKVLVHALGVEEGDIKPSATLQGDPGAESIDFLDITFRRLNRIDDLFIVDLAASYIRWRLGGSGAAETDDHAPAFHHSPEDLTLAAISTGS